MATTLCGFPSAPGGLSGQGLLTQFGPTLQVDVGFDPNYNPFGTVLPDLPVKGVHALVDTGASESCIDSGLAMQLNLPIIDRQNIGGVSGIHQVNMHLGHIAIPALGKCIYGRFAGVDLIAGGQPHSVLIGRAFLQYFLMVYDGRTGQVSITDDIPPMVIPAPLPKAPA